MSYCGKYQEDYDYDAEDGRLESLDALRLALSTAPFFTNINHLHKTSNLCQLNEDNNDNSIPKCAIHVNNVSFEYKPQQTVLNRITIAVPKGKIYALLGSNSSGKTTLLKCIIGRLKPKSGSILIFGTKAGKCAVPGIGVGYMPQEMALYNELTIDETLHYFGHLYHLPMAIIYQRINFLLSLLHLPDENKLIGQLTDNHRWRMSLAVALIHSPPLLLLDEPTVNVDPLLRGSIWNHLNNLCKEEGLTVLITSHYFDEAIDAYMAGVLRNGTLLAEDHPKDLLNFFNTKTMENVFLRLCQIDDQYENSSATDKCSATSKYDYIRHRYRSQAKCQKWVQMADWSICDRKLGSQRKTYLNFSTIRLSALVKKNLYQMRGNATLMLFFFLFPTLQMILFFCASIGKEVRHINVAVHNGEVPQYLSRTFLKNLDDRVITQQKHSTLESAIKAVENGNAWSVISLSENFTESLKLRFTRESISRSEARNSDVQLYIDLSNPIIGQDLIYTMSKSLRKLLVSYSWPKSWNHSINADIAKYALPIDIQQFIYGSKYSTFTEFLAPGYIIAIIFITPLLLTAYLVIKDELDGHLARCLSTGTSGIESLLSHLISQLIILVVQEVLIIMVTFAVFRVPLKGSIILLLAIVYIQGVCGIAFGLLIAAISPDGIFAVLITSGSIIPGVMLTGITWPIESMPTYVRIFSYILPLTLPIESLRCIISRGMNIWYFKVMIGFTISFTYSIVVIILAFIIFKRKTSND